MIMSSLVLYDYHKLMKHLFRSYEFRSHHFPDALATETGKIGLGVVWKGGRERANLFHSPVLA